jgi:hypothetical protein
MSGFELRGVRCGLPTIRSRGGFGCSCRVPHRRKVSLFGCIVWALGALLGAHSPVGAQSAQKPNRTAQTTQVEEIYVARSVRESRVAPTEFCAQAKTGFNSDSFEYRYTLRSIATRASDGRMVNANIRRIGAGHGCFGRTADPAILNFYLDLNLGKTAFRGTGACRQTKSDFPERGLIVWRCFLNLSDPLGQYVGGQLTSNTITSLKDVGVETDPPGYTQSSIATIRLWKTRRMLRRPSWAVRLYAPSRRSPDGRRAGQLISNREKRYGGAGDADPIFASVWHERPPRDRVHCAAPSVRRCNSAAYDPARP